jgi:hypothetical protein
LSLPGESSPKNLILAAKRVGNAPNMVSFLGSVTQQGETHIGLGALHGRLIVGPTLAGYDPTPENIAKLISLTREEEGASKAALDAIPKK